MTEQEIDECKRILARRKQTSATADALKGRETVVIAAPSVKRESMHSLFDRERRVLIGKNANLEYYQKIWA